MNEAHHEGTNTSKATKGNLDAIVEDRIILELKAVDVLHPIHEAQLLTYLRLSGLRLGFLVNFNAPTFKEALRRRIL
ncbi:MAG: GxxExxY protein [Holophagaceae bacterium]|nr:GxxExxY protein [Holophagaceae bacterium]